MPAGWSRPRFPGPPLVWENTCCCLTSFRSTSRPGPASCNPRPDRFSRFEVNQLQIPLASRRVKTSSRRPCAGARVRCGSSGRPAGSGFPCLRGTVRRGTDQRGPGELWDCTPTDTTGFSFFWRDVEFEPRLHCIGAAVSVFPRCPGVCAGSAAPTADTAPWAPDEPRWPRVRFQRLLRHRGGPYSRLEASFHKSWCTLALKHKIKAIFQRSLMDFKEEQK